MRAFAELNHDSAQQSPCFDLPTNSTQDLRSAENTDLALQWPITLQVPNITHPFTQPLAILLTKGRLPPRLFHCWTGTDS